MDVISTDALQRAIFLKQWPHGTTADPKDPWVACAEPSPDTMTSIASSVATALKKKEIGAEFADALAQQVAQIGLRTQSITLLRDEAYRLCEGYMDGAISGPTFTLLHRRLQNVMIAELAIEQLTGYAKPTPVTIGGNAKSVAANDLLQVQDKLDKAQDDLTEAERDVSSAKRARDDNQKIIDGIEDPNNLTDDQKKAKADAPDLESKLANAESHKKDVEHTLEQIRDIKDSANAPTSEAKSDEGKIGEVTPARASSVTVASAVQHIVDKALVTDLRLDFCLEYLVQHPGTAAKDDPVYNGCAGIYLQEAAKGEVAKAKAAETTANTLLDLDKKGDKNPELRRQFESLKLQITKPPGQ